jgi:hypothetical protein
MLWTTKTVIAAAAVLGGLGALGLYYQQPDTTASGTPMASASGPLGRDARLELPRQADKGGIFLIRNWLHDWKEAR